MSAIKTMSGIGPLTTEKVEKVEAALLKAPQAECPLTHLFSEGICIRQVQMPKGAIVIGHAHRFADMNILLTGRLTLLMPDGTLKEMRAPQVFVGTPGRKIAYIQEDVTWQNVWATNVYAGGRWRELGRDIEAIEGWYLDKSPGWQADQAQRLALARLERTSDRESFQQFLATWGMDAESVRRTSEETLDCCDFPAGVYRVQISQSAIEGLGVFATGNFGAGEVIAPARVLADGHQKRTPAGRYTNHGKEPNAVMVARVNGDMDLVASREIKGCLGGQLGEEITVDYRQVMWANLKSQKTAGAAATIAKAGSDDEPKEKGNL